MTNRSPLHPVAGLILAAGASSRLGTDKRLVALGGEPLLRRAARRALAAGLSPVIVVLGAEGDPAGTALEGLPVITVVNPRPADGMPSSLRAGIAVVPAECDALVVLLPDMPLVTDAMLADLVTRFRAGPSPLVITLYGTIPAPPTLYARALFPALLAAAEGGREVVRAHRNEAAVVRQPAELLVDVDLPEDLERLRAREDGT